MAANEEHDMQNDNNRTTTNTRDGMGRGMMAVIAGIAVLCDFVYVGPLEQQQDR